MGYSLSVSLAPRVSVIVPVHDEAALLPASVGSILRQTWADLEVIIVGDGAGPAVEAVARAFEDPRVRWFGLPKAPGYGYSNRGRAIAQAAAPRVAYLAPDDLWAPDHLERLVTAMDADRLDLVFSRPVLVWADGEPRPHYLPFDLVRGGVDPPGWLLTCVSPTHVVHTRDVLQRAGGWTDGVLQHGDIDVWLRCRSAGARIGFLPAATTMRLPAYAFRATSEDERARMHARLAERLAAGALVLGALGWPWHRRVGGWVEDVRVVGPARGPKWVRALLQRQGHR
jgi:GT2 family glycosyltransferase